jgi:hypothetical protein
VIEEVGVGADKMAFALILPEVFEKTFTRSNDPIHHLSPFGTVNSEKCSWIVTRTLGFFGATRILKCERHFIPQHPAEPTSQIAIPLLSQVTQRRAIDLGRLPPNFIDISYGRQEPALLRSDVFLQQPRDVVMVIVAADDEIDRSLVRMVLSADSYTDDAPVSQSTVPIGYRRSF